MTTLGILKAFRFSFSEHFFFIHISIQIVKIRLLEIKGTEYYTGKANKTAFRASQVAGNKKGAINAKSLLEEQSSVKPKIWASVILREEVKLQKRRPRRVYISTLIQW